MRLKIASMRSRRSVSGCRWPSAGTRPGSVTSTAPAGGRAPFRGGDAFVERRFDLLLEIVGELAERGPRIRRRGAERLEQRRDEPALAREIAIADRAQRGRAPCAAPGRSRTRSKGVDLEEGQA